MDFAQIFEDAAERIKLDKNIYCCTAIQYQLGFDSLRELEGHPAYCFFRDNFAPDWARRIGASVDSWWKPGDYDAELDPRGQQFRTNKLLAAAKLWRQLHG